MRNVFWKRRQSRRTLMYTGHISVDVESYFNETQYLAFRDDGINFYKCEGNPAISSAPIGAHDFRNPKSLDLC